jgi:hypothetical protein
MFSYASSQKKNPCSRYKTGHFLFHVRDQGKDLSYSIIRNDTIQTEINHQTGDTSKLRIKWTGDCSYELRFLVGTAETDGLLLLLKKSMVLSNVIQGGTERYYLFESKNNLSTMVLKDTIWVKSEKL